MAPLTRIQMVVCLQSVDLFAYCTAEQMVRIASIASQRRFERGEQIYVTNDPADSLYCVIDGGVRLDSSEGKARKVGAKATFGVEEILSDRLRGESATADENTTVLAIDADDFFDLLSNNIEIVKSLFRKMIHPPPVRELAHETGPSLKLTTP